MKNPFNEIYLLSARRQFFVIVLICAIIAMAGYWLAIFPLQNKLALTKQQGQQLTQLLQKLYYQEFSLEEKMSQLPETKILLNEGQKKFIKYNDMNKLLNEIIAISKRDKLQIKSFSSENAIAENNYLKQPFKIILQGDYLQTAQFIEEIANLPWTVVIGNFSLAKISSENIYSTEFQFFVYYLNNKKSY